MKIAVTGCNGSVGKRVALLALQRGHQVVGIDLATNAADGFSQDDRFEYRSADLRDFDVVLRVLEGCEAIASLAGVPNPTDYKVQAHNTNVVISWNILRAAAELGIIHVAQASSVNVITMVYSQKPDFHYFPIDEEHPCHPDEPYGLSKVIAELQGDTIVRRYRDMRVASLRFSWSVREKPGAHWKPFSRAATDLWGWVHEDAVADAFLLAIDPDNKRWSGHEAFFISAPIISYEELDSRNLRLEYWPDVPIKEGKDISGQTGFFDCSKANRLLGWAHPQ
ncbi:NAD(P)-binding protein [Schizophyllum commune H4-8]|uniref:NAD-dependent epimerase/dehydratase domain-containing protein n=1 Tax=Schizophyllum commune (strain H4-8 / FGSC 9210) TaxID=578458 RepID=D8Q4K5_SCHCM|nr:NAD(P)-binding protein [Schizophyllum commune H4-8]KAI5892579.1 NAD(P)-binding protein [Schizophyllum commune H4-8]